MGGVFLEDGAFHVRVRDDVVGDQDSVDDSKEEEGDGWADGVEFWDGEEEEESLEAGADEEEGLQGEVRVQALVLLD